MEPDTQYITSVREEQHCVVRYYFLHNMTPTEIHAKLKKVYGDETMGRNTVFMWYRMFKAGQVDAAMRQSTGKRVKE